MAGKLAPEEWAVVERLAECHALMVELPGLDFARFNQGIEELQDMIFALPAKRAILGGTHELDGDKDPVG